MLDVSQLSPLQLEAIRALHKAGIKPPPSAVEARRVAQLPIVDFMHRYYYTPDTGKLIQLEYWQQIWLNIIAGDHKYSNLRPFYSTVYFTGPKKIGKTALSGGYARWRAESSTLNDEILFFANDETQSRGRAYADIQKSIELSPLYDKVKRVLFDEYGNAIWRIIEDFIEHVPTATKIKAVNVDYRGEAGANPSLTCWTEVWGYDTDKQFKLFDEMTPVLTRARSQRYLEGYAGYTGRSKIQERVEQLVTDPDLGARRLTLDDIPDWPWPDESDALPLFANDSAGIFAYIDRGTAARKRVPWTQGPEAEEYYKQQALTLTPEQYDRLHLNQWITDTQAFIPLEWWHSCADKHLPILAPWRTPIKDIQDWSDPEQIAAYINPVNWRITGTATPVLLSADASVSGDCTALSALRRNPTKYQDVVLEQAYVWTPPRGGKLDYETTPGSGGLSLKHQLIDLCMRYNVVQVAYDEWQLHHLMNELRREAMTWCRPFGQATPRDIADKQLYDLIKTVRITYNPNNSNICHKDIAKHMQNASRQQRAKEDTKMRIIKSAQEAKIDLVISISMGAAECLRLDI